MPSRRAGCTPTRPLAIYVPRKYVQGEQLGRRRHKMEAIQRSHEEIAIDWNRNYAVIYEWLKGIDAAEACRKGLLDQRGAGRIGPAGERATCIDKGFAVSDNKPQHIIVRPDARHGLMKDPTGKIALWAGRFRVVEADARTRGTAAGAETSGLPDPTGPPVRTPLAVPGGADAGPDHGRRLRLRPGGEHGRSACGSSDATPCCSTISCPRSGGARRAPASARHSEVFETVTKDNVHLVWRVSRVGQIPDADPFVRREKRILDYGYNSPFEEFSIAMELSRKGIETTYPRAIYMTGHRSTVSSSLVDNSRYESHAELRTPEGHPSVEPPTRVRDHLGLLERAGRCAGSQGRGDLQGHRCPGGLSRRPSDASRSTCAWCVPPNGGWRPPVSKTSACAATTCCCRSTANRNWPSTTSACRCSASAISNC